MNPVSRLERISRWVRTELPRRVCCLRESEFEGIGRLPCPIFDCVLNPISTTTPIY
jgi:hypothetical protein